MIKINVAAHVKMDIHSPINISVNCRISIVLPMINLEPNVFNVSKDILLTPMEDANTLINTAQPSIKQVSASTAIDYIS